MENFGCMASLSPSSRGMVVRGVADARPVPRVINVRQAGAAARDALDRRVREPAVADVELLEQGAAPHKRAHAAVVEPHAPRKAEHEQPLAAHPRDYVEPAVRDSAVAQHNLLRVKMLQHLFIKVAAGAGVMQDTGSDGRRELAALGGPALVARELTAAELCKCGHGLRRDFLSDHGQVCAAANDSYKRWPPLAGSRTGPPGGSNHAQRPYASLRGYP